MKRSHLATRFATYGALLLLLVIVLAGCSLVPGSGGAIRFDEIFEERRENENRVVKSEELDADGDGQDEWLVFYEFDPFEEEPWDNAPIKAVIYDALPCDPPILHTWRLPIPDNDYLGEGDRIDAFTQNWLDSADPGVATEELIIHGPGPANTLSIFRFDNDQPNFPCAPLDPNLQRFNLLGFFRADGRILWDVQANEETGEVTTLITTYRRTAYERSQLAIKSVYAPRQTPQGETYLDAQGETIAPQEQTVAFMFGTPAIPLDSPYPEKAVAAFYLALGIDNEGAQRFLTEELAAQFDQRTWGLDIPPSELSRVLIHSISYTPDVNEELAHLEREVTVVVVPVNQNNQQLAPRRLTWRLRGFVVDNPEDCEWRLAELLGVEVTPGLGQLMPELMPEGMEGIAVAP